MILRTALAASLIAAAALPLAGLAEAAPLARSEVTKLFPGQFEAQVKGYRVNFTGTAAVPSSAWPMASRTPATGT